MRLNDAMPDPPPRPRIEYLADGQRLEVALREGANTLGRHPDCDIQVLDRSLPRDYIAFERAGSEVTFISPEGERRLLEPDDEIAVAGVKLVYRW